MSPTHKAGVCNLRWWLVRWLPGICLLQRHILYQILGTKYYVIPELCLGVSITQSSNRQPALKSPWTLTSCLHSSYLKPSNESHATLTRVQSCLSPRGPKTSLKHLYIQPLKYYLVPHEEKRVRTLEKWCYKATDYFNNKAPQTVLSYSIVYASPAIVLKRFTKLGTNRLRQRRRNNRKKKRKKNPK